MRTVVIVARVLIGLAFALMGILGFVIFAKGAPPLPGLAGEFNRVFFASGWVLLVDAVQLIAGVLLLANRYVVFAMVLYAAVLVNILTYHITMQPAGIVPGAVLTVLWFLVAYGYRGSMLPILAARVPLEA